MHQGTNTHGFLPVALRAQVQEEGASKSSKRVLPEGSNQKTE